MHLQPFSVTIVPPVPPGCLHRSPGAPVPACTVPRPPSCQEAPRASADVTGALDVSPQSLGLSWAPPPLGLTSFPSMCLRPCAQVALLVQTPPRPEGCKVVTVPLPLTPAIGPQAGLSQVVTYRGCPQRRVNRPATWAFASDIAEDTRSLSVGCGMT